MYVEAELRALEKDRPELPLEIGLHLQKQWVMSGPDRPCRTGPRRVALLERPGGSVRCSQSWSPTAPAVIVPGLALAVAIDAGEGVTPLPPDPLAWPASATTLSARGLDSPNG